MVAFFPLIRSDWFEADFLTSLLRFLRSLLFGSTFPSSWYITALTIDCCLVYALSRKLSAPKLFAVGLFAYLVCLAYSSYYGITRNSLVLRYCLTGFITLFCSVVNGFPVGILWIILGKFFADNQFKTKNHHYYMFLGGILLLLMEDRILTKLDWILVRDCYLFLPLTSYAFFQIVRNATFHWQPGVHLRNLSTIVYASHGAFLAILTHVFAVTLPSMPILPVSHFCIALASSLTIGAIILTLKKCKPLSWLRYGC